MKKLPQTQSALSRSCLLLSAILALLPAAVVNAAMQTIANDAQWTDTQGVPIKAQGGCIIEENGTYHWFGPDFIMDPANHDNDAQFHAINHYTSTDLKNWTYQSGGRITVGMNNIPFQTWTWVGRPWVLKRAGTPTTYVMVIEMGGGPGGRNHYAFLTATDLYAQNAWTFRSDKLKNSLPDSGGTPRTLGDLGVYQEGAKAWLLYSFDPYSNLVDWEQKTKEQISPANLQNHGHAIVELNPGDFMTPLSSQDTWCYVQFLSPEPVPADWTNYVREAAAVFKKDGKYYYFTSAANGWNSTKTRYRTKTAPATGPELINPMTGYGWSDLADVPTSPSASADSFNTQHDFVLPVTGTSGTTFMYCGDRWSNFTSGYDTSDNYRWFPLTFNNNGEPTINGYTNWQIDTVTGLSQQTDSLQNPGFESEFTDWSRSGSVQPWTTTDAHGGTKAANIWSQNPYTSYLENTVENSGAGTYTAKLWTKAGGSWTTAQLEVKRIRGTEVVTDTRTITPSSNYQQLTLDGIRVEAGDTIKVCIWIDAAANAWFLFDDFEFYSNVVNQGFENGGTPTGWNTWTSNGSADAVYIEASGGRTAPKRLSHWKATAYQAENYQTVTGLPTGYYTLRAWVKSGSGQAGKSNMSVKGYGGGDRYETIPDSDNWTPVTISNIYINNGQCRIGFWSNANAGNWLTVDDVELTRN